jgi:CHAT domain-containing protein
MTAPDRMSAKRLARGVSTTMAVFWLMCAAAAAQTDPAREGSTALVFDQTIARDLARGQEHRYQLALQAGDCVRVTVEQRGIDVVLQALGPDAELIAEVQDEITTRGAEDVDVVAEAAGIYTFAITPAPGIVVPGSYAIRVDRPRAATGADRSLQEARTLRAAAAQRVERDDLAGAVDLLERALTLTNGALGPDDRQVADVTAQLADVYLDLRNTVRAEPLFQRAIAIMDKTLGAGHPAPAFVRSRLAKLYQLMGERPRAEALVRQAIDVIEKTLGPDHVLFVRSLLTLEVLLDDAEDFEQAEEIVRRQLAILERIDYADTILYAQVLSNLGSVYLGRDDARAERVLQQSLALCEKLRGHDSYFLTNQLVNLGILARGRKDYATAEAYYRRAFSIRERMMGSDNPDLVLLLNNLANVYDAAGDNARALETHFQALRIEENALGPYHRYTLITTANIANLYAGAGDVAQTIAYRRRAETILEKQLALNLAVGSERQKLAFMNGTTERTERTISLHLRDAPADPDAGALAALVVLQRKGRVLDAMTDTFAAARQRVTDPAERALRDQLDATLAQLARVALNAPQGTDPGTRRAQIAELEARRERLEGEIGAHDAEFRAQTQPVTLQAVQAAIPDDAALLEFAVFRPYDTRADSVSDSYGPPHYAAYVVRKDAAPRGVDLGPAQAIDEAIATLRKALGDARRPDLRRPARAVDEQVMQPLRAAIGDARRLLISPDGALNLVPFDALIDARGRFLIQRYAITYLTSGRDLLRMQVARTSQSAPVIVADPLFGEPAPAAVIRTSAALPSARPAQRGGATADRTPRMYFSPLPATATEGRAIKALFPEATLLVGPRATKAAVQQVEAPRMLHIASHGFFLREAAGDTSAASINGPTGDGTTVAVENQLLWSGVALAGANLTRDRRGDGILTALEASALNLWGTKLVTLSACDTGIGQVRDGEGVYGLRRAFVLAGTETLVMSLWPVSDYVTREMMTAYYTGLRAGLGRGDALRRVKLAMLKRPGRQHPFYWASFIQSGEWATLDGRR